MGISLMAKWIKTNFPGVRYRVHETRKHGVKRDQYFTIRYKIKVKEDGRIKVKDREEGLGWASGGWSASKAYGCLKELRENKKSGQGPQTLEEKRKLEADRKDAELEAEKLAQIKGITLSEYFDNSYLPDQKGNKKPNSIRVEEGLFDNWIRPAIGTIAFLELAETDLARVKKAMMDKGLADKTVYHALAVIRQILNHAKHPEIYLRAKVKMPKVDNAKLRYLTADEIATLLSALKLKSDIVHDQAFISVNCGLRFSEVAGLRWEDVNFETGTISIRDAKTGSRVVFLNDGVTSLLKARKGKKKTGLVFPAPVVRRAEKRGEPQERCSKTFQRVADELFNEGINDRRLKITFHSLRHTFGTHVYENSGDLYLTQKALGHKTMTMAQRYAKMSETKLREAFNKMSDVLKRGSIIKDEVVDLNIKTKPNNGK